MNRFFLISLGISFSILLGVLYTSSSASAVSIYDDIVEVSPVLQVQSNAGNLEDITDDYMGLIQSQNEPCYNALRDIQTDPNGKWWITQINGSGSNGQYMKRVQIGASLSNPTITWSTDEAILGAGSAEVGVVIEGGSNVGCNTTYGNGTIASKNHAGYYGFRELPFLWNFEVNYPIDYEGEIVPDTIAPPRSEWDYIPDTFVINGADFKITWQDRNFNTFDGIPFTCPVFETAPVIEWVIAYLNEDTMEYTEVESGTTSATVQVDVQLPEQAGQYMLISKYYCGDESTDPIFTEGQFTEFEINNAGILENQIIEDCLLNEFPFIDFENCLNNMATAISLLTFNKFEFPGGGGGGGGWTSSEGCHTLTTLHTWLNLEPQNTQLCPKFSQNVRDTVTPFITMFFGFVTLGFLTQRGSGGWD